MTIDLKKYHAPFIQDMGDMAQIFDSQGNEIELEWLKMDDMSSQMFPDESTWSLKLWEKNYGLTPFATDTEDDRRAAVIAKLVPPETVTLALVQQMADELAGEGIWIEEEPELSHVNIWIMDPDYYSAVWQDVAAYDWRTATQWTWEQMMLSLSEKGRRYLKFIEWWKEYKPAHLGYTTKYFQMRWKDCLPYTWRDLSKYSWLGLLMNMKQVVAKWQDVQDNVENWQTLNDGYTWRTTKQITKETDE